MKRVNWCARSLLSGLLGLVIALVHALYLGVTAPNPGAYHAGNPFRIEDPSQTWVVVPASAFGVRQYDLGLSTNALANSFKDWFGRPIERGTVPEWVLRPSVGQSSISRGFGWPWVALSGTEVYVGGRLVSTPGYIVRTSDFIPTRLRSGFLANGLVWGVVAFVCLSILHTSSCYVRRRVRDRRGQCIHCGYPRTQGNDAVCPECGKASRGVRSVQREGAEEREDREG